MLIALLGSSAVWADPQINAGDAELRHDLEYLADRRLISIPITTWPISWAEVSQAIESIDSSRVTSANTQMVIARLQRRLGRAVQMTYPLLASRASVSDGEYSLRGFRTVPRGRAELDGSLEYVGKSFAGKIQVTAVGTPQDGDDFRLDGSYAAYIWNNVAFTAGYQDRWWGPGQTGSLILSNNSRPIPGLSVKRHVALQSNHRFLRWMGPWTAQAFAGQLESDRFVSRPYLLGARVVIKPFRSLELGVSRTAQWGGEGRPTSFESLINLIRGRDNVGDGISRDEEPGNQLAGFDGRFSSRVLGHPVTLYGQMIGEDEAGGFPSRFLGQFGVSTSMPLNWGTSSLRLNMEYSDTACQFYDSEPRFNCAYNSDIYRTGYRYRGQSLAHSTDGDARQFALLATLNTAGQHNWSASLRMGELNRGGITPELENPLSPEPVDFLEVNINHSRPLFLGKLDIGVGYRQRELQSNGQSDSGANVFVSWSTYVP